MVLFFLDLDRDELSPPSLQRLVHGGIKPGSKTVWNLCSSEDAVDFDSGDDTPFILMIDRGDCTFAKKVRAF